MRLDYEPFDPDLEQVERVVGVAALVRRWCVGC